MTRKQRVVVIGSGFGGAISACRLAESGRFEVILLERGARYGRNSFPRSPEELRRAVWQPSMARFGFYEFFSFPRSGMEVAVGAGLGGGSLVYSNVLHDAAPEAFRDWPGGINRRLLAPHVDKVLEMLEASPYPVERTDWPYANTLRTRAMQRAVMRMSRRPLGKQALTLEFPHLAVRFGPRVEEEGLNAQGKLQTTCRLCGECNIGCNHQAKNTLDLNYIACAEKAGVDVRTHAEVIELREWPGGGWQVVYRDPRHPKNVETILTNRVVLAAGAMNSTALLLKMKQRGILPRLPNALGARWSPNGDVLGIVRNLETDVAPATGPVITTNLRIFGGSFPEGQYHELFVEDGGFPTVLTWWGVLLGGSLLAPLDLVRRLGAYLLSQIGIAPPFTPEDFSRLLVPDAHALGHSMILFGMGHDAADGRLRVNKHGKLKLDWSHRGSAIHYARLREAMIEVASAMGGTLLDTSLLNRFHTVHPLGGCPMGESEHDGVVDARTAEVFGHKGLYVIDGSIVPRAVGPNPSLTIAALAELYSERMRSG